MEELHAIYNHIIGDLKCDVSILVTSNTNILSCHNRVLGWDAVLEAALQADLQRPQQPLDQAHSVLDASVGLRVIGRGRSGRGLVDDLNLERLQHLTRRRLVEAPVALHLARRTRRVPVRRLGREADRTGDRREAAVEADNAYENRTAAHELGKEIDRTARNVLRVDQDGSSTYLGKLPKTPSRKAYLKLERSPNLTPEEQERFLVMISISPDGAAYATLTAERILCGRFAAGEDVISTSAQWAFHYACITGARFLLGERAIMRRRALWQRYTNRWVVKRCPLCRKQLNKGRRKEHGPRAAGATA